MKSGPKKAVKKDFWRALPKPFFVLAPMANVTDAAFRAMFAKYGKPDVMWTEFVSADGLVRADARGKRRLLDDLKYSPKERPIVAQLFSGHPFEMMEAAKLVKKLGFDGLDINMGCPDRAVEKQGGGAALIKSPDAAREVIMKAREGAGGAGGLPVSVKTRLGYNKEIIDEWIGGLLGIRPVLPALTVHLRTRKEMSEVPAHWEVMRRIVELRDKVQHDIEPAERTLIIGNGDVGSLDYGRKLTRDTGCDGVMIGRGIFGTPWFFEKLAKGRNSRRLPKGRLDANNKAPKTKLKIMLEHARLFDKMYGKKKGAKHGSKNFATMKKHFKAYVSGWDGAKELRARLMEAENFKDVERIVVDNMRLREKEGVV